MGEKVSPGSPLRIGSNDWNGMLDMLAWWKRHYGTMGASQPKAATKYPDVLNRAFIKNNSAANRRQGEILKLGSILTSAIKWKGMNYYAGTIPASAADRIGVLLEAIDYSSSNVGLVQVAGIAPAWVDMTASGDGWCYPDGTNAVLKSAKSGIYRIAYAPSGTGEKQCLVDLEPQWTLFGKAGSSISKGSTGTITIWGGASGSEAATSWTLTCRALYAAIASGKYCVVENINGVFYAAQVEC